MRYVASVCRSPITCPVNMQFAGINFKDPGASTTWYGISVADILEQLKKSGEKAAKLSKTEYLLHIDDQQIDKLRSFIAGRFSGIALISLASGAEARIPSINPLIKEFSALAYISIGITMFIAILSLTVSTIGGLLEQRRSLVTLRLGDMTVRSLQFIVIIESLVSLLSVTMISAGLGVLMGAGLVNRQTTTIQAELSLSYIWLFISCIIAAIIATMLILPSLKNIADPELNRTE